MVERSLPIPEVRGSNPVIEYLLLTVLKRRKRGLEWAIYKKMSKIVKVRAIMINAI